MKNDFKSVLLADITEDKNQPRKYFDVQAMQELAENVKKVGVLSPIMIRPDKMKAGHYFIVFGERRYRAAIAAGLKEIPCQIRDITAEEALDLQIIENLQRKDVHAMEEAIAFKSFRENQKWSTLEIGNRIGKDDRYVRGRIVLCQLIEQWRKIFYMNSITLTAAMKIAQLSEWAQKQLYKDRYSNTNFTPGEIHPVPLYDIKQLTGDLKVASFDTENPLLNKAIGPCSGCPFNSAVSKLFPEDEKTATCSDLTCYKLKTDTSFDLNLLKAQEIPDMIYVFNRYMYDSNEIKRLTKLAQNPVLEENKFDAVAPPLEPRVEDYDLDDYDNKKEMMEDFKSDVQSYKIEVENYEKSLQSGKLKQAFVMHGDFKGTFINIKLRATASNSYSKSGVLPADLKAQPWLQLEEDIKGINTREKRNLELDDIKKWDGIRTLLDKKKYSESNAPLTGIELLAAAHAIYSKLKYSSQSEFRKLFGFSPDNHSTLSITPTLLNRMVKYLVLDVLPPDVLYNGFNAASKVCLSLADQYCPKDKTAVIAAQDEKATKRKGNNKKRIDQMKRQIDELKMAFVPAKEKKAPKKAAVKKATKK